MSATADDAVQRRADLVAHVGQELGLGVAGGLGLLAAAAAGARATRRCQISAAIAPITSSTASSAASSAGCARTLFSRLGLLLRPLSSWRSSSAVTWLTPALERCGLVLGAWLAHSRAAGRRRRGPALRPPAARPASSRLAREGGAGELVASACSALQAVEVGLGGGDVAEPRLGDAAHREQPRRQELGAGQLRVDARQAADDRPSARRSSRRPWRRGICPRRRGAAGPSARPGGGGRRRASRARSASAQLRGQ